MELKHAFETLQHMFIFHVCLFYEMNSVQHSKCNMCNSLLKHVTYFSETWLVSTMQQTHETYKNMALKQK